MDTKISFDLVSPEKLIFNDSVFISSKIGNMILKDCKLEIVDNEKIIKLKVLLDVLNEKKFYQKFQIPKSSRINLKNIYAILNIKPNISAKNESLLDLVRSLICSDSILPNCFVFSKSELLITKSNSF